MAESATYKVIGTRPIRHDGVDKVTGRAIYGADVQMAGLLHGKVLRSPHAHARIRSIDVSRALALPGVKAVATSADLPAAEDRVIQLGEGAVNLKYLSNNILAADKVLYKGHPVAAVAATSPHIATAMWNPDGQLTIWESTQGAFTVQRQLAPVLGMPVAHIRVIPAEIGGGFGGKINLYLEPIAAVLSRKTGHPVKVLMNRAEVFESTGPTPGSYIRVKMGATKDGHITAAQAYMAYEAGGYPGSPIGAGMMCIFTPYDVPNVLIDGFDVVVNKPKTAPYRAPGATNAAFASETVVDELCEKLAMDPLRFRLRNAAKEGTRRPDGPTHPRIGYLETVQAALDSDHYRTPLEGPNVGRGVASGYWFNVGLQSSVSINVNADGSVTLVEGSTDIGGEGGPVAERAARIWKVEPPDVTVADGVFHNNKDGDQRLTFKEVAAQLGRTGGPVTGRATVAPRGVGGAFATHIVDLQVDPETGKVTILRYTAVQDVGKAIHPSYVEGQMQGGAVQGIGWALNEEYF